MRFSALLTALLMLLALPGQAAEGLKPYQATYKAQFDLGFHFLAKPYVSSAKTVISGGFCQ